MGVTPFTEKRTGILSPYIVCPAWGVITAILGVPVAGVGDIAV